MIIPDFIKPGDTIGVTALSRAMEKDVEIARFASAKKQLEERGYKVFFTDNVIGQNDRWGRSSAPEEKARQLNELIRNPEVRAIFSAAGGDYQAEILPLIDMDAWKADPKWIQGFSDNTSTLFYLMTKSDIATAYGACFGDFGMQPWDESVNSGLEILEGKRRVQESFRTYQNGFLVRETGLEGYAADGDVLWKNVCGEKDGKITMEGHLIGGCMDCVLDMSGTPFDGTREFLDKYKDEGIIWFLESFSLGVEAMMCGLWKLKAMGYFDNAKGIIFGRPMFYPETGFDGEPLPTYEDVLRERLTDLNIPVIMDADIGHKGPQFVTIMGAKARIECENGRGRMTYID